MEVMWIRVPRSKPGQSWPSRALDMIPAYTRAIVCAMYKKPFDMVYIPTSPPLVFAPAVVRAKLTGEDITLLHHDIFPQNARISGLKGPDILFDTFEFLFCALSRLATHHETLSKTMAHNLEQKLYVDVKIVPLPTPISLEIVPKEKNSWLKDKDFDGKFVVMYAGNFGRMYDFDIILKATIDLKEYKDIAFVFVGSGFYESKIRDAKKLGCGNIHLFPPVSEAALSELLCAADVHVVPLRQGCDTVMWPHKLDSLSALKLPVLIVGFESEINVASGNDLSARILDVLGEITEHDQHRQQRIRQNSRY